MSFDFHFWIGDKVAFLSRFFSLVRPFSSPPGQGTFYNFGNRPNFLTAMCPPEFPERGYEISDLKDFNEDLGIINFLSGVTPQDFEQPRALYQRVFDDQMRKVSLRHDDRARIFLLSR